MQKKLQVFISSTFTDLEEERQAAVQAILNSGHIPAGMELFKAGDRSQKETIKKWIEESDVYMLILGGRYGSIDEETGKSYTHWEYDYAGELKKPRFAIVIDDQALEGKVKEHGTSVTERANYRQYEEFKQIVLGKISKFYSDVRDIKIAVLESLKEFERDNTLSGWISGAEFEEVNKLRKDYHKLLKEKDALKSELDKLRGATAKKSEIDGLSIEDVKMALRHEKILIRETSLDGQHVGKEISAYRLFISFKDSFTTGVTNEYGMQNVSKFLFYEVAPTLMSFGLLEKVKISGAKYERIQTSKEGLKFLKLVLIEESKRKTDEKTPQS
ncbi:DUF4062 domain-containing protein [Bacillus tropicus]|uniref:DUF4062 domain-containing protein n=1 Tax=Bacillus tropicus TaxID=2026188 RepID=UPI002405C5D2|nr:DUF4062 domain-containing protein [Bacillus tropicus]MDF9556306.1 DUF4062 domain-containing protein [Bacillus tropicus]MDF9589038.1 DUF4062 domain-containing protein [Bacillus tropicus]MDF9646211.1 DUF4062 domain-containing protein [Bacillus tropicus]